MKERYIYIEFKCLVIIQYTYLNIYEQFILLKEKDLGENKNSK